MTSSRMSILCFLQTSIGKKLLMAATGLCLCAFLVVHLAGNLLLLVGDEAFNKYSYFLEENPLLVPAEIGLLLCFVLHIVSAIQVSIGNRRARPEGYAVSKDQGGPSKRSFASRTMMWSGLVILAFLIWHIKSFKYGEKSDVMYEGVVMDDLFKLVSETFQQPLFAGLYVAAMIVVGNHLRHAFASAFQTLGLNDKSFSCRLFLIGKLFAAVIAIGFAMLPLWFAFCSKCHS